MPLQGPRSMVILTMVVTEMSSASQPRQHIASPQKRTVAAALGGFGEGLPNPTFDRTATSVAPRAFARIFSVSRGAAGVGRSTPR